VFFTLLSIVFTVLLGFNSNIFLVLIFFAIANLGCQEAIIFYNALMTRVASPRRIGLVSGIGRMCGYSGAILALYLTKPVIIKMGYQPTFIFTGVLFLIFALPCLVFVKEDGSKRKTGRLPSGKEVLFQVIGRLKETLFSEGEHRRIKNLLAASFFLLCAVNTVILFMSVYAGKVFGLGESETIDLIAFSTVFAILGSFVSGFISDIVGYARALLGVFLLWALCILGGTLLSPPFHWLIGALAGASLGSTWVIFRAMVIKIVPEEKIGETFGLFNMVTYFSGIVGPLFWGLMLLFLSPMGEWGYRLTFMSMTLFIGVGAFFLARIRREL
jgi:UMF1 family MFS transporter